MLCLMVLCGKGDSYPALNVSWLKVDPLLETCACLIFSQFARYLSITVYLFREKPIHIRNKIDLLSQIREEVEIRSGSECSVSPLK